MDKRGKTSYPGNLVWQPQTIKGVAAMATFREFTYPSSDGIHICWAGQWLPDEGQPRAVVQIVHGVAEHMGGTMPSPGFWPATALPCAERTTWPRQDRHRGVYGYFGQKTAGGR